MEYEHIVHSFEPIFDSASQILILGTLPSVKSRETNFFFFYKPVNEGNSCTSYMPQDFGDEEQINLANFCKGIGETGAK